MDEKYLQQLWDWTASKDLTFKDRYTFESWSEKLRGNEGYRRDFYGWLSLNGDVTFSENRPFNEWESLVKKKEDGILAGEDTAALQEGTTSLEPVGSGESVIKQTGGYEPSPEVAAALHKEYGAPEVDILKLGEKELSPEASKILSENKITPEEAFEKFQQWKAGEVDGEERTWAEGEDAFSSWVEIDWAGGEALGTSIDVTGKGHYAPTLDDFEQRITETLDRGDKKRGYGEGGFGGLSSGDKVGLALGMPGLGERIDHIGKEKFLLSRSEEFVVPTLQQQFEPYGFTFEQGAESGKWYESLGDEMTVTAPNGKKEEFNLDAWFEDSNIEETKRLKKFLRENKPEETKKEAIINQLDLDNRFKALKEEELALDKRFKEMAKEEREIIKETQFLGDEDNERKAEFEVRALEFMEELKAYAQKNNDLNQIAGEYTMMKSNRGYWGHGAFFNSLLDGAARISANVTSLTLDIIGTDMHLPVSMGGEIHELHVGGVPLTDAITDGRYQAEYWKKLGIDPSVDLDDRPGNTAKFKVKNDGTRALATRQEVDMLYALERDWKGRMSGKSNVEILKKAGYDVTPEEVSEIGKFWIEEKTWKELDREAKEYARDQALKDVKYGDKGEDGVRTGGMLKEMREGLREVSGVEDITGDWTDLQKQSFWGGALLGVTESIPAMIGGAGPGGFATRTALMYAQVSDHLYEEMENDPDFAEIPESEKALLTLPIGAAVATLESLGLRGIAKNSTFIKGILLSSLKKAPTNVSARTFQQIVRSEVESGVARGAIRITSAGLVEFETGFMQEWADIGGKAIYNELKGKDLFTTPEGVTEMINQTVRAGAQEMIGGFTLGTPGAIAEGVRTNDMRSVDNVTWDLYNKMIKDPNYRKMYEQDLKMKIARGIDRVGSLLGVTDGVTEKEAAARLHLYDRISAVINEMNIASDFTEQQKKESLALLLKKQDLKSELSQIQDDGLKAKKKEEIDAIDGQLNDILYESKGREKMERQTTPREFEEGMEVVPGEFVTFEFEEGKVPEELESFEQEVVETEEGQPNKVVLRIQGKELVGLNLAVAKELSEAEIEYAATLGHEIDHQDANVSVSEGSTTDVKVQNQFIQKANQVVSALGKVIPGLKIQLHDNHETAKGILEESDAGGYVDGTIHINMSKAVGATIYHEALHAVLKSKLKVNDKIYDATVNMANAVRKVLPKGTSANIDSMVESYRQIAKEQLEAESPGKTFTQEEIDRAAFSSEEYLAMTVELIADNYATLKTKERNIIKRWIGAIADFIGIDVDIITKSDKEILDFINDLNKSLATGRKLTDTSALEKAAEKKGKPTTKEQVAPEEGEFIVQALRNGLQRIDGGVRNKEEGVGDYRQEAMAMPFDQEYTIVEEVREGRKIFTRVSKSKDNVNREGYVGVSLSLPESTTKTKEDVEATLNEKWEQLGGKELDKQGGMPKEGVDMSYKEEVTPPKEKVKKSKEPILLAPNGKPSNLNEVQWNTVRTPEFKRWFGDWENDPENASKVLDENGEPRVMYHGGVVDFNIFDSKKLGKSTRTSIAKLGFFFAGKKVGADQYVFMSSLSESGPLTESREFFLDFKNPYIMSQEEWGSLIDWGSLDTQKYKTFDSAQKAALSLKDDILRKGHDSIIMEKGDSEVVAFEPNQAKLADGTNRTFDPASRDIRKSRYFKDDAPRLMGMFLNQVQDDRDGGTGTFYFTGDMHIHTKVVSPDEFLDMTTKKWSRTRIERIKEQAAGGRKFHFPRINYLTNEVFGVDEAIAAKELGETQIPMVTITRVSLEAKTQEIERITNEAIAAVGNNPGKVSNHITKVQGISPTAFRESIAKSAKFKELMGEYVPTLKEIGERYGMDVNGYVTKLIGPADLKKMTKAFKERGYIVVESEKNQYGLGGDFYLTNQAGYKVNPMKVVKKSKAKVDISKKDLEKFARLGIINPITIQAINQIGNISFTKDHLKAETLSHQLIAMKNIAIAEEAIEKSYKEISDKADTYVLSQDSPGLNVEIQGEIDAAIQDGIPDDVVNRLKRTLKPGGERDAHIARLAAQQKETINEWLSYFEQSDYSVAFKYLLLDAILTTNYDFKLGKYLKRDNKTGRGVTPFDAAALAEVDALVGWDMMDSPVELGAEKSVQAPMLELYVDAQMENARRFAENNAMVSTDKGRWIKFDGGSKVSPEIIEENAKQLMALVQDTYWCTKTSGKSQLMKGDFYVYVEDLVDGGIRPMIAVRMKGDKVGEVRGNESRKQDLSPKMFPIAEDFLKEHIPNDSGKKWLDGIAFNKKAKDFLEKVKDMPTIDTDTYMEYVEILEEGPRFNTDYGDNAWVEKIQKEVKKKPISDDVLSSYEDYTAVLVKILRYKKGDKVSFFDWGLWMTDTWFYQSLLSGDNPNQVKQLISFSLPPTKDSFKIEEKRYEMVRKNFKSMLASADVLYYDGRHHEIKVWNFTDEQDFVLNATKVIGNLNVRPYQSQSVQFPNLETISGSLILEAPPRSPQPRRDNPMISLPSLKTVKGALKLKTSRISLPKLEGVGSLNVEQADTDIKIPNLKSIDEGVFVKRDVAEYMEERNKGIYLNSLEYIGYMPSAYLTEGSTRTDIILPEWRKATKIINAPKLKKIRRLGLGGFTSEINEALIQPEELVGRVPSSWKIQRDFRKKKALSLTKSLSKVESIDVISIPPITTGLYKLNLEGVKRIGSVYPDIMRVTPSSTLNELHLNINAPKLENTPTTNYEGITIVGPKKPTDIKKSLKAFVPDPKNTMELFDMIKQGREEGHKDEAIKMYLSRWYEVKEIKLGLKVKIDELTTLPPSFAEIEGGAYEGLKLYHSLGKKVKKDMTEEQRSEAMIEELIKSKQYEEAGDPKLKRQKTSLQLRMEYDLSKSMDTKKGKSLSQRMREARLIVRERTKGGADIRAIQAHLKAFLRRSLPKGYYVKLDEEKDGQKRKLTKTVQYKKAEVDKLIAKITKVKNIGQAEQMLKELEVFVAEKNSKLLFEELNKKLAKKTTISQTGKRKGRTLDILGQRIMEKLKTSGMILPISKKQDAQGNWKFGKITSNFDTMVRNVLGLDGNKKPTQEQAEIAVEALVKKNKELEAELIELEESVLPFKQAAEEELKQIAKDYGISEAEAKDKFGKGIIPGREEAYLYAKMALEVAININNAALMENSNPNKVGSLELALEGLDLILASSQGRMKMDLARQTMEYQRQFALAYKAVTGIKIDPTNEESMKALKVTRDALSQKARESTIKSKAISTLKSITNIFSLIESLPDLLSRVDKLPGQLFGGDLELEFSDRVDESTIEFKRRWMAQQIFVQSKLREFYGPGWKRKSRKYSRPQPTGIILDGKVPNNLISLTDENLELILSQNQMYYWYNQFKDPANDKTFEKMFAIEMINKDDTRAEKERKSAINNANSKKIMAQIESLLEPDVKAFADWQVDEYFPSVYEHYNRTYQRVYRTDMPWNQYYAGRLYREGKADDGLNLLAGDKDTFKQSVAAASLHHRTTNTQEILAMDGTSALLTYTRDMEYFAAMAETLRDIQKVFTNKDIKAAIKTTHGEFVNRMIDKAINKIATKGVENTTFSKVINYMGTSFIISRLALSPVVMIKQLTSAITYSNDIGFANWLWYVTKDSALGRVTQAALGNRDKTLNVMREIKENSVYMQERGFDSIFKVIENYSEDKMVKLMPNATKNFFVNALMFTTTLGDKSAIYLGGIPNYLYYKDQIRKKNPKYTEEQVIKQAIKKFERDTKKTQQSSDIQDKDFTQAGIFRPFNVFLTTPRQYLRKEIRAWRGMSRHIRKGLTINKKKRESLPDAHGTFVQNLRQLVMYHVVMPAFYQWVALGFPNLLTILDEDEEEDRNDMVRAMIIGNLNALFIVGEIIEAIGDAATGKPWFDDVRGLPAVTIVLDAIEKFKRSSEYKDPKLKEKYMIDAIAELTTILGIPGPTALKFKRNYQKVIEEGGSMDEKELLLRILNYSNYMIEKESGGGASFGKRKEMTKSEMKIWDPEGYELKYGGDLGGLSDIEKEMKALDKELESDFE